MEERKYRTKFAIRALDLADLWKTHFDNVPLSGGTPRHAILSVPEGQSTAGGAQAHQSISLVPLDRTKGILVAGSVDGVSLTAELRGFAYVNETHRLRFGKPIDLPAAAYLEFLQSAENLLKTNGYTVTVVNQLPEAAKRRYQTVTKKTETSSSAWVVLLFFLLAGGAAAAYLLLYR